ncbi:MAG: type II secretion system GspH family protein [Lachnospiraceae bacterium]|nr:type II secretion system GspH family protein [Lachnospiraceae bacterium]
MKDNNKGFSLVELLIVVAIMVILIGVMAANIGRISGYRAKECRTKLISSMNDAKLETLSKATSNRSGNDTYLVLFKNGLNNGNYMMVVIQGQIKTVKRISKGNVTIKYSTTKDATDGIAIPTITPSIPGGGSNITTSTDSSVLSFCQANGFKIWYNRSTGAFLPLASGDDLYELFCSMGNYNYGIHVHPTTGKVETGGRTKAASTP